MPIKVWSWNLACGSPGVGATRWTKVRKHLNDGDGDVLLLQEARTDLVDEDVWQVVAAEASGHSGSCSVVASRRSHGHLTPLPLPAATPAGRAHCVVVADFASDDVAVRLASLYVPWQDSSAEWMRVLLGDEALQRPEVIVLGADLNSPVGPNPPPHPMFGIAESAGWTWATTPLLSKGPTMKQSQIDHLLTRGAVASAWSVDSTVLQAELSDHALLRAEITPQPATR